MAGVLSAATGDVILPDEVVIGEVSIGVPPQEPETDCIGATCNLPDAIQGLPIVPIAGAAVALVVLGFGAYCCSRRQQGKKEDAARGVLCRLSAGVDALADLR